MCKEKEGGGVVSVVIYVFIKNMMVYRDVLFCLCGCLVFLRVLNYNCYYYDDSNSDNND